MSYEVIIVGGGIGGLTTAALLAARGVKVCLLEKETNVGGCASTFEKFGYEFELTAGLYAGWNEGVHQRIFEELKIKPPETKLLSPSYSVRLPDGNEIPISTDREEFEANIHAAFPKCADAAIEFYGELEPVSDALNRLMKHTPDLRTVSGWRKTKAFLSEAKIASRLLSLSEKTTAGFLTNVSHRFKRFIDAQLQMFSLCSSDECAYIYAAVALTLPRRGMHAMRGGAKSLSGLLAQSIKQNGGVVRLNSPALRLIFDSKNKAIGVDLLNGERVECTKAIVSNLTVQDTYGRLIGLNQTPNELRARLKNLKGWGAYIIFLTIDESAAQTLSSEKILALSDWQEDQNFNPEHSLFMLSLAQSNLSASEGKRPATISTFTEAEKWFAYHESEDEHEEQDKEMLEKCWSKIHRSFPQLENRVEIIETMTPRTFYELTRRRLGMVGGVGQSLNVFGANSFSHRTHIQNLYMVGDSVFPGNGVAAVTHSALIAANEIAPPL